MISKTLSALEDSRMCNKTQCCHICAWLPVKLFSEYLSVMFIARLTFADMIHTQGLVCDGNSI